MVILVRRGLMQDWIEAFRTFLSSNRDRPLSLLGVGNPIKSDDSVGLYIARQLRRRVGSRPSPLVRIHGTAARLEALLSKLDLGKTTLLFFDAVEANLPPGSIVFTNVQNEQYGFFATHGIPLKLHPAVRENCGNVFMLGVQPNDLGVGEKLSEPVLTAADEVVGVLAGMLGGS
jgi:hydrogenase maturation protease